MALTAQVLLDAHTQADGRRYVLEIHSDAQGEVYRIRYKGRDTDDRQAIADARAVKLARKFADGEAVEALIGDAVPALRFQTAQEFIARVREIYRTGTGEQVCKIARWFRRRALAGDLTENQIRNAFGLTPAQWDVLKVKLQQLDESLNVVETAVGE